MEVPGHDVTADPLGPDTDTEDTPTPLDPDEAPGTPAPEDEPDQAS